MSERRKGFVVRAKTLGRWEETGSRAKVEGLAFGRGGGYRFRCKGAGRRGEE